MTQPTVRIAEDEHGPRVVYDDIVVGQDLGSLQWTVTEEDIDKQCRVDEDYDDAFSLGARYDGRVAPPQIQYRPPRWLLSRNYNVRGVFYKWEFEHLAPLRPGVTITVSGTVTDKRIVRGREHVEFESVGRDEKGEILFRTRRTHVLDMADRSAPRAGRGIDSGVKSEKI
jgi:acyl dehydratase